MSYQTAQLPCLMSPGPLSPQVLGQWPSTPWKRDRFLPPDPNCFLFVCHSRAWVSITCSIAPAPTAFSTSAKINCKLSKHFREAPGCPSCHNQQSVLQPPSCVAPFPVTRPTMGTLVQSQIVASTLSCLRGVSLQGLSGAKQSSSWAISEEPYLGIRGFGD